MLNDLVSALDLAGQPGGPFEETAVDSAVAQVRGRAGWHIAPVRTETVAVQSYGGSPFLFLPTRCVVGVSAVRRNGVAVTGYHAGAFSGSMLFREWRGGWEYGTYEVDLTHGYAECPPELLGLIANVAAASGTVQASDVARVTVGAVSTDYRDPAAGGASTGLLSDPLLEPYVLPAGLA